MIKRELWVDHKFNLGLDKGWTPNIMSRIKDCEIRILHHCASMNDDELSARHDSKWSIKEHIGHLIDLEQLWIDRFIQLEKLNPELVAADMANKKTKNANHNNYTLEELLNEFQAGRKGLVDTFNGLSETTHDHSSYHARLGVLMKPVDLLFFIAEHDSHHLTSIIELKFQNGSITE
jgi:uncharacterized damage-inducible protein DinB